MAKNEVDPWTNQIYPDTPDNRDKARVLKLKWDGDFKLSDSAYLTVHAGELIQSYIDKAISGDTIAIDPGIFNENLVIDKSLTLKGAWRRRIRQRLLMA